MSSPVAELLVQENLCTDLFKSISESLEASSHGTSEIVLSNDLSDDVVGHLLDRMIQILPPEERDIFGCIEEKNIEEIIQEANELIRTTTPLFSSSESGEKSWSKLQTAKSKPLKACESSSLKEFSEEDASIKEKSESDSIGSSLESILMKESVSNATPGDQDASSHKAEILSDSESEKENQVVNDCEKMSGIKVTHMDTISEKTPDEVNTSSNKNITHLSISKQKIHPDPSINVLMDRKKEVQFDTSNEAPPQDVIDKLAFETEIDLAKQKYIAEVQQMQLSHEKEIFSLTMQINSLNSKIHEFQRRSKFDKSPDLQNQQLERLESEMRSQEQLLGGYERENKKLCKEISTLKEAWKQKETKLIEEKQKLQNHLQGMVAKSITEALEEQVKDARETIVKLQIELAAYKSKNKELEVNCERLRGESQRLQNQLINCRCDGSVGRRDKYSLLASSNFSSQIQELKNVISRKDIEIAQMNTTLGILKGELSTRELSMSPMFNQQLETHSLTISQLQAALSSERQTAREWTREKDQLLKENQDLKRQVRELESIVKRRQRSDSCFTSSITEAQTSSRLAELEKELSARQEALSALHNQFLNMQKKYEDHIQELEDRLKVTKEEVQTLKLNHKKDESNHLKLNLKKYKQGTGVVKEETHLLATIRGLRQEATTREKEINKLNKEIEEVRQTNKRLQKEREKQLNSMPTKMMHIREKASLRKMDKTSSAPESRPSPTCPINNNMNPLLFSELQESNLILKSKTKSLQEEVKRLEQDLISMHNKRVHDI